MVAQRVVRLERLEYASERLQELIKELKEAENIKQTRINFKD